MYLGLLCIIVGAVLWYREEKKKVLFNFTILLSICIILFGAALMTASLYSTSGKMEMKQSNSPSWWHWIFVLGLIFIGSVAYTIAAYYHLKMEQWTFLKAFLIAVPFLLIEYQFSLRGNQYARTHLNMNAVQITILTMIFYFFNAWILNLFVLKHPMVWWREISAFFFILMAFLITTRGK